MSESLQQGNQAMSELIDRVTYRLYAVGSVELADQLQKQWEGMQGMMDDHQVGGEGWSALDCVQMR